jgi:hypothetical protein
VDQCDLRGNERHKFIHRVLRLRERLRRILEPVVPEQGRPVVGAALAFALSARPTLEITNSATAINAGDTR